MSSTPPPQSPQERQLIALYVAAEAAILTGAAQILRQVATIGTLAAMPRIRRLIQQVTTQLDAHTGPLITAMVAQDAAAGRIAADRGIARINPPKTGKGPSGGRVPPPPVGALSLPGEEPPDGGFLHAGRPRDETFFDLSKDHGDRAAESIGRDLLSSLQDVRYRLSRLDDDLYKAIAPRAAMAQVIDNNLTLEQAQAAAWQEFVRRGITGFTDKSGRNWALSSYVEMAVRTASARAFQASAIARMQAVGIRYFTVPPHVHPCPLCGPWQGAVLTIGPNPDPSISTDGTVEEATAAGLFHPNAILGDQAVKALGEVQNGVRAWYSGPSVNLRTANGNRLSVSPHHPVLTTTGWLPAKLLRKGMQVFSTLDGGFGESAVADEELDHPVATFEQVLDALATAGGRSRAAAAADHLHGDGRYVQGEIDVVSTDRGLVAVLEAHRAHQTADDVLPRADVQSPFSAGDRAELLATLRVGAPVGGPLADWNASVLQSGAERRVADAEDPGEVLAGLACGVAADELVDVDFDWFEGHAYDLQTTTGAYVTNGILVHNCRDVLVAWFPSTPRPERREWTGEDQLRYDATQKQRAIEREIRKAKAAEQHALTPEARTDARRDVRAAQARMRAHLTQHPQLGRQSRREQPNLRMASQHLTPWKPPPGPKPPYSDGSAPDWTAAIP